MICALTCALVVGLAGSASAGTLTGAGATTIGPLLNRWAGGFSNATGDSVGYKETGSAVGISEISGQHVDFAATDEPMTGLQSGRCDSGRCVTIPMALSATGIAYRVPGVGEGLKLTGGVLAQIFTGRITNWDNTAIKHLNPKLKLPNLRITPVERGDDSGETYALARYLEDVVPSVASKLGPVGGTVHWPAGRQETGNGGVEAEIGSVSGAIGYVSVSDLVAGRLDVARIENAAGNFEFPNLNNVTNAAANVRTVPTSGRNIVDPPSSQTIAYPISLFMYVVVQPVPVQPKLLSTFLKYCLTTGMYDGVTLDFPPLPKPVSKAAQNEAASLL